MSGDPSPTELEGPRRDLAGFTGGAYDKGRGRAWQVAWLLCQSTLFKRWWLPARWRASMLRSFGGEIGRGVLIRHDVTIHWPWKLRVGDHSWIGVGVWILNLEPVEIGSHTCVSQEVLLCTGSHDRFSPTFEFDNGPIVIGDRAWIATRATVLRGVRIGDDAVVGAGSVVARDVADGDVVRSPASDTARG